MTSVAVRCVELVDWRTLSPAEREAVAGLEISADQLEFAGEIGERRLGRVGIERTMALRL